MPSPMTIVKILDTGFDAANFFGSVRAWLGGSTAKADKSNTDSTEGGSIFGSEFTRKDEMTILADLAALVDAEKITEVQGENFAIYLRKKTTPRLRREFRKGYITATRLDRQRTLAVLARGSDPFRNNLIIGTGFDDLTMVERALVAAEEPINELADWARDEDRLDYLRDKRAGRQETANARADARANRGSLTLGTALTQFFRFRIGRRR
jgi:hypothetical protein